MEIFYAFLFSSPFLDFDFLSPLRRRAASSSRSASARRTQVFLVDSVLIPLNLSMDFFGRSFCGKNVLIA
jgi:hypothetical protein